MRCSRRARSGAGSTARSTAAPSRSPAAPRPASAAPAPRSPARGPWPPHRRVAFLQSGQRAAHQLDHAAAVRSAPAAGAQIQGGDGHAGGLGDLAVERQRSLEGIAPRTWLTQRARACCPSPTRSSRAGSALAGRPAPRARVEVALGRRLARQRAGVRPSRSAPRSDVQLAELAAAAFGLLGDAPGRRARRVCAAGTGRRPRSAQQVPSPIGRSGAAQLDAAPDQLGESLAEQRAIAQVSSQRWRRASRWGWRARARPSTLRCGFAGAVQQV